MACIALLDTGPKGPVSSNKPQTAQWQSSTKWLKKRFAKVNENEKDRIVKSAIPKNTQKRRSLGGLFSMIFYTKWSHQQNNFVAPIKNMQGINACLKECRVSCERIFGVL